MEQDSFTTCFKTCETGSMKLRKRILAPGVDQRSGANQNLRVAPCRYPVGRLTMSNSDIYEKRGNSNTNMIRHDQF